MSKRKKNKNMIIDSKTLFDFQKPKYNAYMCGYGSHGKNKYNRKEKHKTNWRNHADY